MATRVVCDQGHRYPKTCREAARQISLQDSPGICQKCGKKMRYLVSHTYPYNKLTAEYEVISVYTPFSSTKAEREGRDPMVFLMKDLNSLNKVVWSYYWTKSRLGKWANGGYPPLLTLNDLKSAIKKLETSL